MERRASCGLNRALNPPLHAPPAPAHAPGLSPGPAKSPARVPFPRNSAGLAQAWTRPLSKMQIRVAHGSATLHNLGREHYRAAARDRGLCVFLKAVQAARVHPGGEGFVYQPEFRVGSQESRQDCLVDLPAGEPSKRPPRHRQQIQSREQVFDFLFQTGVGGFVEFERGGDKPQGRPVGRDRRRVGQESEPAAQISAARREGLPVEEHLAAIQRDHSGQGMEQRGFARAIGTQHGHDFARRNVERHAVQGGGSSESLDQLLGASVHGAKAQPVFATACAGMRPENPLTELNRRLETGAGFVARGARAEGSSLPSIILTMHAPWVRV